MTTKGREHTEIVYPETDGMPLPDGEFQSPLFREIVAILETHFEKVPGCHVNGNTFIYYQEGDPRRWVSPDCYVVFDIDRSSIERFNTYRVWEVGKPPDFVLEIGAPSTATTDLMAKRQLYAELGIGEYWRYDKTGGDFYGEPLAGEALSGGEYQPLHLHREADGMVWGHSPTLNLDLCWDAGRLRFFDGIAGQWLLSHTEEHAAKEKALGRVQEAEERVQELEAELRRLRGD